MHDASRASVSWPAHQRPPRQRALRESRNGDAHATRAGACARAATCAPAPARPPASAHATTWRPRRRRLCCWCLLRRRHRRPLQQHLRHGVALTGAPYVSPPHAAHTFRATPPRAACAPPSQQPLAALSQPVVRCDALRDTCVFVKDETSDVAVLGRNSCMRAPQRLVARHGQLLSKNQRQFFPALLSTHDSTPVD